MHLEISKYKSHYLVISPTAKNSQQLIYSDKNTLNKEKKNQAYDKIHHQAKCSVLTVVTLFFRTLFIHPKSQIIS